MPAPNGGEKATPAKHPKDPGGTARFHENPKARGPIGAVGNPVLRLLGKGK